MPDAQDERRQDGRRWVEGIRAGEEAAFEKLFEAYYRDLCAFAAGYVGSRNIAREVVQDVFLKIWVRRSRSRRSITMMR